MNRKRISNILAVAAMVCGIATFGGANALENGIDNGVEAIKSEVSGNLSNRAQYKSGQVIAPSGLNVRTQPNTGSAIKKSISYGESVVIKSTSGGWHHIEHRGTTGYVSAEWVKVGTSSGSVSSSAGKIVNTGGEGVNLRKGASTSTGIVMGIREGEKVDIISKSGEWYNVKYNGYTGYVHGKYVSTNFQQGDVSKPPVSTGDTQFSANGKVYNTNGTGVNLRKGASTSTSVILTIKEGDAVKVVAKNGEWYKVEYKGYTGYAHSKYINTNNVSTGGNGGNSGNSSGDVAYSSKGKIYNTNGTGVNLRKGPSTSTTILMGVPEGVIVNISAKNGEWYKVSYNGSVGYVSSKYVNTTYVDNGSNNGGSNNGGSNNGGSNNGGSNNGGSNNGGSNNGGSNNGSGNTASVYNKVLEIMKSHLGSPYVWGGSGEYITDSSISTLRKRFPDANRKGWYDKIQRKYYNAGYRAFDCSGLMQWAFGQAGVKIGRTTYDQVYNGTQVDISKAKPGDLLIYKDKGHVGMYIGDGKWIESPYSGAYVRIANVPWNKIGYARRVI